MYTNIQLTVNRKGLETSTQKDAWMDRRVKRLARRKTHGWTDGSRDWHAERCIGGQMGQETSTQKDALVD